VQLPGLLVLILQVVVFGAALVAGGHRPLAIVFRVIVVSNAVLMYVCSQ
jgi:hypothetical protein